MANTNTIDLPVASSVIDVNVKHPSGRALLRLKGGDAICGIYKITCTVTGHTYIGQSIDCSGQRKKDYSNLGCKPQHRVYRSIKKHGWANHIHEVIHECDEAYLNHWEAYYVYLYDTWKTPWGLNIKDGGGSHGRFSDDVIERMRNRKANKKIVKYSLSGDFVKINKSQSEAGRECGVAATNISTALDKKKTCGGFIWRKYSDNYPLKLSQREVSQCLLTGKETPINQYTLTGEFVRGWDSYMQICREFGTSSFILVVCQHENKYALGYQWRYAGSNIPVNNISHLFLKKKRPIIQFSIQGVELRRWNTAPEAEKKLGIQRQSIYACCRGQQKTALGFIWKYADEYDGTMVYNKYHSQYKFPQYDMSGILLKTWFCLEHVVEELGIRPMTHTDKKFFCSYGFIWGHNLDEYPKKLSIGGVVEALDNPYTCVVNQYSEAGDYIRSFRSIQDAAKSIKVPFTQIISSGLHGNVLTGYKWSFPCKQPVA